MQTNPTPESTTERDPLFLMEERVNCACAIMDMMADKICLLTEAHGETGSTADIVSTGILHISNDAIKGLAAAYDGLFSHVCAIRKSAESTPPPAQKSVRKPV